MAKGRDDRWPDASAFRDALAESAVVPPRGQRAGDRAGSARAAAIALPAAAMHLPRNMPPAPPALPQGWMLNPDTREYGREALDRVAEETRRWSSAMDAMSSPE